MDQPSLRVLGRTLSKSLAADLKNSRGRKTLSLHNFSANEDIRLEKDSGKAFSAGTAVRHFQVLIRSFLSFT